MSPELLKDVGQIARAMGGPRLYGRLAGLLGCAVGSDATVVVRYAPQSRPDILVNRVLYKRSVDLYLAGYYRFDPFNHYWETRRRGGVVPLRSLLTPEHVGSEYFRVVYRTSRITDEIGMFLPSLGATAIALFVERREGDFSTADVRAVERLYPLVLGLHKAHVHCLTAGIASGAPLADTSGLPRAVLIQDRARRTVFASPVWRETDRAMPELSRAIASLDVSPMGTIRITDRLVVHGERLDADFPLAPLGYAYTCTTGARECAGVDYARTVQACFDARHLTRREQQIVGCVLTGCRTEEIAQRLGIGRGTVKNHRRRLYHKLGIATEREMFCMFLSYLLGTSHDVSGKPGRRPVAEAAPVVTRGTIVPVAAVN